MRRLQFVVLIIALLLSSWVMVEAQVTDFQIYGSRIGLPQGHPDKVAFLFRLSRTPVQDFIVSAQDVDRYQFNRGYTRWWDGLGNVYTPTEATGPVATGMADRISYHTAYARIQHRDPGRHDYLDAFRVMWQEHGQPVPVIQIIDQGMLENPFNAAGGETQGLAPYPYERVDVDEARIDLSRPGGVVQLFHLRYQQNQLLQEWTVPAIDPQNSRTRWYYQGGGTFFAVHDQLGVFAQIIVAAMHPAYGFRVKGVPTGGL